MRAAYCSTYVIVVALCVRSVTYAHASADYPAAIVVYPYVTVDLAAGIDTRIQLTNVSSEPVEVRCYYEDLTPECVDGGLSGLCAPGQVTCPGGCRPRGERIPFRVRLTAEQPVAWRASAGLTDFPLDGIEVTNPDGTSNQFSRVPELGAGPLTGTLRCVVVSSNPFQPGAENLLLGLATIELRAPLSDGSADAAQYRAIGLRALPDSTPNDDEFLQLGGAGAEYDGCPAFPLLQHLFDGGPLRTGTKTATVETTLVLTTCGSSPAGTSRTTAVFRVVNEFGQRLSTSAPVFGQLVRPLSLIDTTQADRSIFSVQVNGTLAAQTLVVPSGGSGLHAVTIQTHRERGTESVHSDAITVHGLSQRFHGDVIAYRPPLCPGDCDFDGAVSIDEIVAGVNIALELATVDRCPSFNRNGDPRITIDELVSGVLSVLEGCAEPIAPPEVTVVPTPTPTRAPSGDGPRITYLGLATADEHVLRPDETDSEGRPVFARPFGQGMTIVVEAQRIEGQSPVSNTTYSPGALPGLQLLVSRPLGNGDATVCENDGRTGGIPGTPSLEFSTDAATVAAINDLGCRAFDREPRSDSDCIRKATLESPFSRVASGSEIQFCVPIARDWAFPVGETMVAVRAQDSDGNAGAVQEMVVRVDEP